MKPHVVKFLNKNYPILAANIFDAAIFVLGETRPDWIREDCVVRCLGDNEIYSFRATRFGDKIEFDWSVS